MSLTLGAGLVGRRRSSVAAFSLTAQAWSGLWLPNYSPTSWAGTASAGGSGARALAEATNSPPSVAEGAFTIPDFSGTKYLANATNVATFCGSVGYYVFVVARVDAIDTNAAAASIHTNDALLSDTLSRWHLGLRSGGGTPEAHLMHWDGASPSIRPFAATGLGSLGQMALIEGWWDGATTISCAVNGGTPGTAAVTGTISAPGTLRMGRNYNTSYLDGQIWGAGIIPMAPDAAFRLNVANDLRSRSGFALA